MKRPMPRITALSRPFWEGCNEGRLVVQHCTADDCGNFVHYPRVACPFCHRDSLEWREVSGEGAVVSHTTVHRAHHESFDHLVPYVFAAVRLAEGPIVYARLRHADVSDALIGNSVKAAYEPYTDDQKMLVFDIEQA